MTVLNPPGWLENAGATHTAVQMRTYVGMLVTGATGGLRARGGVHPNIGSELSVAQSGTPGMSVEVASGAAAIPGTENANQGLYFVANDATVTLAIGTADPSLPRIDIIQFRIQDSFYSGANNQAVLSVKAGTPAASPVAPTADANAIVLAEVTVGAGVTSILNANIADKRTFIAAVGGVIQSQLEALVPTQIEEGQLWYARDTDKLKLYDGSTHYTVWDKNVQGAGVGAYTFARKTSDTSRTSTTLTVDASFTVALTTNATYTVEAYIAYDCQDENVRFSYRINVPTSTYSILTGWGMVKDSTLFYPDTIGYLDITTVFDTDGGTGGINNLDVTSGTGTSGHGAVLIKGLLITAGTSGNLTFDWAPTLSSASSTTIYKGSYMLVTRLI